MYRYIRITGITLILLLSVRSVHSQYPLAAGSPHGIYIFLDNRIPKDGEIHVQRSAQGKKGENLIAVVEAPGNFDELKDRIHRFEPLFSDLGHYSDRDMRRMWDFIQNYNVIDTLPPVNYPVMHLAAGTAFLDTTAKKGIAFTYTITYYRTGRIMDTKKTNAVSLPVSNDLPVPEFHSMETDQNRVYVDWMVEADPYLYSFRVFRRKNMAGEFSKITPERGFYNKGDSLFLVMNDRSAEPRTVYEYYIEPLDRLENPGKPSDPVVTQDFGQADIPVLRRFDVSQGSDDHTVRLYWQYSDPELVRSISIYRSEIFDSAYSKIAEVPATDSVFTDNVQGAMENYYYYLILQGIMNKSFPSARVGGHAINLMQPSPPREVAAEPVENGVKIYWKHEDPVIMGYYIYRDQGLNDSLQQASGLIPAGGELMSYVDTSKALMGNRSFRYAVIAVNDGYRLSRVSDVVAARPMIATEVLSPSDLHGGFIDGHVILVWDDMNAQDEYLTGYNIYRKEPGSSFSKINETLLLFNTNTFTDTTIDKGKTYDYAVTSRDESGSESSFSKPLNIIIPAGDEIPPAPYGLRVSKGNGAVVLSWPAETAGSSSRIRIYKYEAGQKAAMIAEIAGDNYNYEDKMVSSGHLYFYYLTVVSGAGKESGPGNRASVRY